MSKLSLPHHYSGKVRELYEVDHDRMLVVASDRVSVFDVVLPDLIPDKGRVLTALSTFWFEQTAHLAPNHLVSSDPTDFPETAGAEFAGRAMLVKAARAGAARVRRPWLPLRCGVDRLPGDRHRDGAHASRRPASGRTTPEPIFTPTTKAEEGHDLPLGDADAAALVGADRFEELRDLTLAIYSFGAELAARHGLILADTKLEFGEIDGRLLVIDEIMTPDSSRYWSADDHQVGTSPPSFDKQYVRDHYLSIGWNMQPPVPRMPGAVIEGTRRATWRPTSR